MSTPLSARWLTGATLAMALAASCALTAPNVFAQPTSPSTSTSSGPATTAGADGLIRVRSVYPMDETIRRIRADIADKGILFFQAVDQAELAAKAGIPLRPSTLLEFGNPPLGAQFLTANPNAGLDWPVRLLISQDENGNVWATWTDFDWIARRHGITNRHEQFAKATSVVASITSTVTR